MEGTWLPTAAELGGAAAFSDQVLKTMKLVVKGDAYTLTGGGTGRGGPPESSPGPPHPNNTTKPTTPNTGASGPGWAAGFLPGQPPAPLRGGSRRYSR